MKEQEEPSLQEVYRLTKENNRMLKAMRRDAFIGGILKFVWWILILFVIPYVLFVIYLQPYLAQLQSAYEKVNSSADTVSGVANDFSKLKEQIPNWQDILDGFGGGGGN